MTRFGRIILQKPTPAGEYDEFRVYEEESSKYTPSGKSVQLSETLIL